MVSNPALLSGCVGVSMLKYPCIPPPSVPERPGRPLTNLNLKVSYPILGQNRERVFLSWGWVLNIQLIAEFCKYVTKFFCLPQKCHSSG